MNSDLPVVSGPLAVLLPADPPEASRALEEALEAQDGGQALRSIVARWPAFVDGWARLGEWAYRQGRDVEAFAFFRTAYHRGLDRLRQNGWRGMGAIPWTHGPNRGVLRAIHGLMLASAALGEADEARRCRQLLLDSDPSDPFGVSKLQPGSLNTRLAMETEPESS
jgi:hypothetical protein